MAVPGKHFPNRSRSIRWWNKEIGQKAQKVKIIPWGEDCKRSKRQKGQISQPINWLFVVLLQTEEKSRPGLHVFEHHEPNSKGEKSVPWDFRGCGFGEYKVCPGAVQIS